MDVKAIAKEVRISPIKLRLMADLIRGKNVNEALNILINYNAKSSRIAKKVVDSAAANAVNNNGLDKDKLYIKDIRVDVASTLKRMHPGSRGKYDKRYHRRSHMTVVVAER
jgi:large subunit ribosomal protein L22